ncbi:uncharacterized protein LOC118188897 [Stegodyphus dumicola]|uniref:uncharacterized protein LOC118188897 n=1 Tax=Stegodyphus dumicola TaxID=202533 RepID=UPI0015ADBDF9|nr:uncharacterized protein LOC118188897 [Stegodyphus dumicola]
MEKELENLKRNETWDIVPRPEGRKVVKCKWVFKRKLNKDGQVERYKARLVARGYTQVEGIDYKETFSPVIKTKSIRTLLAFSVEQDCQVHQQDITSAYLYGKLTKNSSFRNLRIILQPTFKIKDLGEIHHLLSIRISRREDSCVTLDQSVYASELLETTNMQDAKGASTPLDPGMKYTTATKDNMLNAEGALKYRQAVGGLLVPSRRNKARFSFCYYLHEPIQ